MLYVANKILLRYNYRVLESEIKVLLSIYTKKW